MRNVVLVAIAAALFSVPTHGKAPAPTPRPDNSTKSVAAENYLDQFIDRSVSPRDDFFHYAVGKWLKAHPIPPSEKSWGIYQVVQDETYNRLLSINKEAAQAKDVPA